MLGLVLAASLMSVSGDGSQPARDVDTRQAAEMESLFAQAQRDFEQRQEELGLQGSAPLVGLESAKSEKDGSNRLKAEGDPAPTSQPPRTP